MHVHLGGIQQEQLVFHMVPFCSGKKMQSAFASCYLIHLSPFLYLLLNSTFKFP